MCQRRDAKQKEHAEFTFYSFPLKYLNLHLTVIAFFLKMWAFNKIFWNRICLQETLGNAWKSNSTALP
jgi:hypothetical protein